MKHKITNSGLFRPIFIRGISFINSQKALRFNRCRVFAILMQRAVPQEQIDKVAMATRTPLSIRSIFCTRRQERPMVLEQCVKQLSRHITCSDLYENESLPFPSPEWKRNDPPTPTPTPTPTQIVSRLFVHVSQRLISVAQLC
jgi:hypothetical protein